MTVLPNKEKRLIKKFLKDYRAMLNNESNIPFNPRSLTIVSQPDIKDPTKFHWISYNSWFDELGVDVRCGTSCTLLESFLDIPINILISAEEIGQYFVSKKDRKKLIKALKLLSDIRLEKQQ